MVKISVIVPFFNAVKTLGRALESIAQQSFQDFECIMVDNNSTDESPLVANEFASSDPRFILMKETQQGVVFASNKASDYARGHYITRMDADDWMPANRLEIQSDFLDQNSDYQVVSGLVKYMPHHENTEGFARYVNWVNTIQTDDEIKLNQFIESPIVNPTAMWRRSVSTQLGMYRNGDFPEDYELWLRWLSQGVKCHKLDHIVLHWYDSNGRLTRTHPNYSEESFYRIKTKYLAQWLSQNNPHHPEVAIWGASRLSRKRAEILQELGVNVRFLIDIHTRRQLDENILHYTKLPNPGSVFILVYLGNMEARDETGKYLSKRGFVEGVDFLNV
jgi:glycosyltransferase involved in cell wall biosynthesis